MRGHMNKVRRHVGDSATDIELNLGGLHPSFFP